MNIPLKDVITSIDDEELYKLQSDLENNAPVLKSLVRDRLKEIENKKRSFCAGCGENILDNERAYTLVFGADSCKKKASFCAHDCLEFFLARLKEIESEKLKIEEEKTKNGISQPTPKGNL